MRRVGRRVFPGRFFAIRAGLLLFMFATLLWSYAHDVANGHAGLWFIYLTHWTLAVEVAYLGCALWLSVRAAPLLQEGVEGTARSLASAQSGDGAGRRVIAGAA